jgi:hypothetical protein
MPIAIDTFNHRVNTEGPMRPTLGTNCHLWTGSQRGGCGIYNKQLAHRVIWKYYNGAIPDGQHLYHICGQSLCVNVDHLNLVTPIFDLDARIRARVRDERTQIQ